MQDGWREVRPRSSSELLRDDDDDERQDDSVFPKPDLTMIIISY